MNDQAALDLLQRAHWLLVKLTDDRRTARQRAADKASAEALIAEITPVLRGAGKLP